MSQTFWFVDDHKALTPAVRTFLQTTYGYTAPAGHTHAALISVHLDDMPRSRTCLLTYPFSFDAAAFVNNTAGLEDAISVDAKSRLRTIRNAEPLTSILGRRYVL